MGNVYPLVHRIEYQSNPLVGFRPCHGDHYPTYASPYTLLNDFPLAQFRNVWRPAARYHLPQLPETIQMTSREPQISRSGTLGKDRRTPIGPLGETEPAYQYQLFTPCSSRRTTRGNGKPVPTRLLPGTRIAAACSTGRMHDRRIVFGGIYKPAGNRLPGREQLSVISPLEMHSLSCAKVSPTNKNDRKVGR